MNLRKTVKLSDFDYNLPKEFIASKPPFLRGTSKLLVYDRKTGKTSHNHYFDFAGFPEKGDVVVFNNTKVINARVYGYTEFGAEIEVMFLEEIDGSKDKKWKALIGNAKRLKNKKEIYFGKGSDAIKIKVGQDLGEGIFTLELPVVAHDIFEKYGHVPLPRYIKRDDQAADKTRYQTVFAKNEGAVAAPTASLNMTKWMIAALKVRGVEIAYVNLKVSWDTFKPVHVEKIKDHKMHSEFIEIDEKNANKINNAKSVWAVGTTVVRTLESAADKKGKVKAFAGRTKIFIYPGYKFKVVDHLLTNFHAPKTTVLMMASAFIGRDEILDLYNHAIQNKYKFLSYGDSMLLI